MKLLRTAEMALRDLVGRGWVLGLLVLVPMVFYAARRSDASWQGMRMACMGLAWAVSTVALFSIQSARNLHPRLRMAGIPPAALIIGRTIALTMVASAVGGIYVGVIVADQEPQEAWAVGAALLISSMLAVPLGILVGLIIRRDFEGMLALITVVGLQTIVDPSRDLAKALPLWSIRSLLQYGIEGSGDLNDAWIHAGCYAAGLMTMTLVIASVDLRHRRHMHFIAVGD